jgi:hypothetical protein
MTLPRSRQLTHVRQDVVVTEYVPKISSADAQQDSLATIAWSR